MKRPVSLREFDDTDTTRDLLYSGVLDAVSKRFPIEDDEYRIEFANPRYVGKTDYSLSEQKNALLRGRRLHTPITGTWRLVHKPTGAVLDERDDVAINVPYYTQRGTIIRDGNEYSVVNQARLRPGVYVRRQRTGEVEGHVNVRHGTGKPFRIHLEPETGIFKVNVGQSNIPLYPMLRAMGVDDRRIMKEWGPDVTAVNIGKRDSQAVPRLYRRFAGYRADPAATQTEHVRYFTEELPRFELDADVNARTLGLRDASGVTPDVLLRTTSKMLGVSRGDEAPDDRDSPRFSGIYGVEDLMRERIDKDAGRLTRSLLRRARRSRDLRSIPRGALNAYIDDFIVGSGLAMPLEETNPLASLEQLNRITKLGEGGIGSAEAVTDEARDVNPGQFGFIDPITGPEGLNIGIDVRAAYRTFKGSDNSLYGEFLDRRTGKTVYLRPDEVSDSVVEFPGQEPDADKVYAMKDGQVVRVDRGDVDFVVPSLGHMLSSHTNLNPMPTAVQAGRQFYGAKFWSQYLPQVDGETPLVDSLMPDGKTTWSEYYGRKVGTLRSRSGGTVTNVTTDTVTVRDAGGKKHVYDLVQNFPFNRMTGISYAPSVRVGDTVNAGDMVAHSNFTDAKTGALRMGRNLRTAIVPYRGHSYEDAYAISRSAASKLATERLHGFDLETGRGVDLGKNRFISAFPKAFTADRIDTLDEHGVVRPGVTLHKGDPIVVAVGPKLLTPADAQLGRLHKALRNAFTNKSIVWEYDWPGVVVDATINRGGARVNVKSESPVREGDKLSTRFGLKGVVGKIIDDDKMPRNAVTNEPYELLLNPMAVLSRVAPNQIMEMALGKLAAKTGQRIRLPQDPPREGWAEWVRGKLEEAGISDASDIFDPETGKTLRDIGDGSVYVSAFHHLAERKLSSRGDIGHYTVDEQPARGGDAGAKRFSQMDVNAALAHGATEVIRDAMTIRGTKNEEFWKSFKLGRPIPEPTVPFIYNKFLNTLRAGGINVVEKGDTTRLLPMTDEDVTALSRGRIDSGDMVDSDLEPVPGGLFDVGRTGGTSGNRWTHIELPEPVPNPTMEEPIRRVLGLRIREMEDIVAGRESLNGATGGGALLSALAAIDLDAEIAEHTRKAHSLRGAARDNSIKALGYLLAAKEQNIRPAQWMVSKVPVLPPVFRPVSRMGDVALVADINELYRDVLESSRIFNELRRDVPDSALTEERANIHNAVRAAYGLGDPITPEGRSKRLRGAIRQVIGDSPKCYDDSTEVLTDKGWAPWGDATIDTVFGAMNPDTGALEYCRASDVVHARYVGVMAHTKTNELDLLVTPNHRHYVRLRRDAGERLEGFEKVDAGRLVGLDGKARFLLSPISERLGVTPAFESGGVRADPDSLAEFLGWWLADGWLSRDGVNLCQSASNAERVERIDALVSRLGVPVSRQLRGGCYLWVIADESFRDMVESDFGDAFESRRISDEAKAWGGGYLRGLVRGYLRGCGEATNAEDCASALSRKLVDDFAVVAMHIGIGFRATGESSQRYLFAFDRKSRVAVDLPSRTSWENYDGFVHCATVPHGLLVVRRNGCTAVSGNSGLFQSKVISKPVDVVGRGVVAPDPNLDMDQVGIPEDSAWTLYNDFVMRSLTRRGFPAARAAEAIAKRDPEARAALEKEMASRPVLLDRAPTWHKFNLLAFYPHIVEGHTVRVSPLVTKGFNMDFDGDSVSCAYVTVSHRGSVFDIAFADLIRRFVSRDYDEARVTDMYGVGTRVFECATGDDALRVVGLDPSGKPAWRTVTHITVHTSHSDACRRVRTAGGLDAVFTEHHNWFIVDDRCELVAAKTDRMEIGSVVPYVVGLKPPSGAVCAPHAPDAFDMDFDTGLWFGHYTGAGYIGGNGDIVLHRCAEKDLAEILANVGASTIRGADSSKSGHGQMAWAHKEWAAYMGRQFGCEGGGKVIPEWVPVAPVPFRFGFIAGYLLAVGKTQRGACIVVEDTFRRFLLQFKALLAGLGVGSEIVDAHGARMWRLRVGVRDLKDAGLRWPDTRKAVRFADLEEAARGRFADDVPMPACVRSALLERVSRPSDRKKISVASYTGVCSRAFASRMVEAYRSCLSTDAALARWAALVNTTTLRWDRVLSVSAVERPLVTYDFSVDGREAFAIDGGYLTHNTANFHVPVSDKAVEQARSKMLPSANLLSLTDLESVRHSPSMEMTMGLFQLTRPPGRKQVRRFATANDAKRAYAAGELGATDPIEVGRV